MVVRYPKNDTFFPARNCMKCADLKNHVCQSPPQGGGMKLGVNFLTKSFWVWTQWNFKICPEFTFPCYSIQGLMWNWIPPPIFKLGIEWNIQICGEMSCLLAIHTHGGLFVVGGQVPLNLLTRNFMKCPDVHKVMVWYSHPMGWRSPSKKVFLVGIEWNFSTCTNVIFANLLPHDIFLEIDWYPNLCPMGRGFANMTFLYRYSIPRNTLFWKLTPPVQPQPWGRGWHKWFFCAYLHISFNS